jgi:hypothetical protein
MEIQEQDILDGALVGAGSLKPLFPNKINCSFR